MSNIFEKATRKQLRFQSRIGQVSVEDLWRMSLDDVDAQAILLHKQILDKNISFINTQVNENSDDELRLEIAKHVIDVRLSEARGRLEIEAKNEKRQALLKILASKQNEALEAKSEEEILAELEALG